MHRSATDCASPDPISFLHSDDKSFGSIHGMERTRVSSHRREYVMVLTCVEHCSLELRRRKFLAGSSHPSAHFQRWHPRNDPVGDTYLYSRSKVRFKLLSNLAPYRFLAHIMQVHCYQFFSPLGRSPSFAFHHARH